MTNAKQLLGWTTVPRPPQGYWPYFAIGTVLPCFVIAIAIDLSRKGIDEPMMAVTTLGFFGIMAAAVWITGIQIYRREKKIEAARKATPDQPWRWDFEWDPAGILDRSSESWKNWLPFLTVAIPLAIVANIMMVGTGDLDDFWPILVGIYGLVAGIIGFLSYRLLRRAKYGRLRLTYNAFPFFVGERLEVTLHSGGAFANATSLKATLRCVQEKSGHRPRGQTQGQMAFEIHRDEVEYDVDAVRQLVAGDLPIRFELPADAPATWLESVEPTYWDLEISAETPGIDYAGHFLIPVYRRHEAAKMKA